MSQRENRPVPVRAAGTVLWRPTGGDNGGAAVEVAVVHRPHRSDWTLPKGKFAPGETAAACAVRETQEETGYRPILGRSLGSVTYPLPDSGNGTKVVSYFAGRAGSGWFRPNGEVDELRWLKPERAAELLDYPTDRTVLSAFTALPADTATMLLVRHAKAGHRSTWSGDDDLRPLSPAGRAQAEALRTLLPMFGPARVHSASRVRCVQTVRGVADDLGVLVEDEPLLTEEGFGRDPVAATRRLLKIGQNGGTPVICSQGGAIPALIGRLAAQSGLDLAEIPCKKGSVWVLSFTNERPRRLLAADYLPSALPAPRAN